MALGSVVRAGGARVFALLPESAKRVVVRRLTPGHTLGSLLVVTVSGRALLVQQRHSRAWQLPGGLLARQETALSGLQREVVEELGARAWAACAAGVTSMEPAVVHDPVARRVDFVFTVEVSELEVVPGEDVRAVRWVDPHEPVEDRTTKDALVAAGFE